jgi:shikimate dehydrogenase
MSASDDRPAGSPTATHTVGVIGWPVEHSLSPAIHNAAFADLGMRWTYVPLPVEPGRLPAALDGLVALGFAGANVTMPHKTEAAELCDVVSDDVRRLAAANTLVVEGGQLHGHNTDAPGFARFLQRDAGFDPAGRSALLFGAGGAARAVALALAEGGLASLALAVRDPSTDVGLRQALDGLPTTVRTIPMSGTHDVVADLIVNATPLGARRERLPIPAVGPGQLVVDLLYHPTVTPLLSQARAAGATAFGGLGLLLHQAALSFERWTGTPAPLAVMSAAALAALADRG